MAAALLAVRARWAAAAPDPADPMAASGRPALEHAVLAYALLWPTHGPARIAAQLRQGRWGGWRVSGSGVYGILRRHGLQTHWERLTRLEARAATDEVTAYRVDVVVVWLDRLGAPRHPRGSP